MSTSNFSAPGARSVQIAALAVALLLLPAAVFAQRTSVARDFPIYNNGGAPDSPCDPQRFVAQMEIVDRCSSPETAPLPKG